MQSPYNDDSAKNIYKCNGISTIHQYRLNLKRVKDKLAIRMRLQLQLTHAE